MQFKFKIQPYQTEAARAVTDVFAGQPNSGASLYLRDLGRAADGDGTEALPGFERRSRHLKATRMPPSPLGPPRCSRTFIRYSAAIGSLSLCRLLLVPLR